MNLIGKEINIIIIELAYANHVWLPDLPVLKGFEAAAAGDFCKGELLRVSEAFG